MDSINPPKRIWTDADFAQMNWHDCRLHGVAIFDDCSPHLRQLRLDIDYIFASRGFQDTAEPSGFWISPATLVFEPERFHLDVPGPGGDWIIGMERTNDKGSPKWIISLNLGGQITVRAPGFTHHIRRAPVFVPTPNQHLETSQRGGISFDTPSPETW